MKRRKKHLKSTTENTLKISVLREVFEKQVKGCLGDDSRSRPHRSAVPTGNGAVAPFSPRTTHSALWCQIGCLVHRFSAVVAVLSSLKRMVTPKQVDPYWFFNTYLH